MLYVTEMKINILIINNPGKWTEKQLKQINMRNDIAVLDSYLFRIACLIY